MSSASSDGSAGVGLVETLRKIVGALRRRPVLIVAGIQPLGYCVWQAFTGFYPTYLVVAKEIAPTTATVLFGGFFALGTLVKPIAGSAYDTYGLERSPCWYRRRRLRSNPRRNRRPTDRSDPTPSRASRERMDRFSFSLGANHVTYEQIR